MAFLRTFAVLACLIAIPCTASARNEKFLNGEFQLDDCIKEDTVIEGLKYIQREIFVTNSVDSVWRLLNSPQAIMEFLPLVKRYEPIDSTENVTTYICHAKPKWYLKTYKCVLTVEREQPYRIAWYRTGGDFREVRCYWSLDPVDSATTRLSFGLHFDYGGHIPGFLVNGSVSKTVTKAMGYCREWMSLAAE